jgi:hypothetical protein
LLSQGCCERPSTTPPSIINSSHFKLINTKRGHISAIITNTPAHPHKMADRAPSPTPSERSRLDAAAKTKEQEEQSKLPYKWTQTIADLEVTIEVPGNFKGKDLDVKIRKDGVKAGVKGQEAILEVCFNRFTGIDCVHGSASYARSAR